MIHTVVAGECLISIAEKYGFSNWHTIYDAPENTKFRERRKNPSTICPGDKINIPEKIKARHKVQANSSTTFVIKRGKIYFSIRLIDRKKILYQVYLMYWIY